MTNIAQQGRRTLALVALAYGFGMPGARAADTSGGQDAQNGLGLNVSQTLKYDSNVFRLARDADTQATLDAGQRHDFISTTQAEVSFEKAFAQHRLRLFLTPSLVRYAEFNQFDYVGQRAGANWSGRVGSDGYYLLRYEHDRVASDLADQAQPELNLITSDVLSGELQVRTGRNWQGVGGFRAARNRNSAEAEQGGDNQGWAADVGMRYAPGTGNSVETRYRHTRYTYPNVIPSETSDNSYAQEEVELAWNWQPSAPSRFEGHTSYVQRRHDHIPERDFSGWVGSLKYAWRPTVDTSLTTTAFKELGAVNDASASYARSYGLRLEPEWDLTAKLGLLGRLEWRNRRYAGFSTQPRANERSTIVGIGAKYAPSRGWLLRVGLNDERRRSDDPAHAYSDLVGLVTVSWETP